MPTFSLVVSTPLTGIEIVKVAADTAEAASDQFLADPGNASCELLCVVEPEPAPVEIVIDMTGGMIEQVVSNQPNTKIVFLDNSKDEITAELENDNGAFAPDIDLSGDPNTQHLEPWVFRTAEVEHNPRLTGHYVRYIEDKTAREAFNAQVQESLNG